MIREATSFTVADYCAGMSRNEIIVNRNYQRSDKVWPPVARSYLIETILKGFPIPKLCLYQVTDVRSRTTHKEIVDGQQRSTAIFEYYNDEFRTSKRVENEDVKNKKYSELDDEYKQKFLEYAINVDLFLSATPAEVVEVFRRMNSYTVPLNAEENRHASYQGQFKWFINDVADKLEKIFLDTQILSEKQLVRMADNKLLTELCDSFWNGIRTTNKKILDSAYKEHDSVFSDEKVFYKRLLGGFDLIRRMESVHGTTLMRPFMVYSLVQAITHTTRPVRAFQRLFRRPRGRSIDIESALANLTVLSQAVESDGDEDTRFLEFVEASQEKTNVRENREVRFKWFCKALTSEAV
jgi:hypothetical protein